MKNTRTKLCLGQIDPNRTAGFGQLDVVSNNNVFYEQNIDNNICLF